MSPKDSPNLRPLDTPASRREFLSNLLRGGGLLLAGGVAGAAIVSQAGEAMVWQIDPYKCTWCGKCATSCVINPSAVKCVNAFPLCGYCDLCTGYFEAQPNALNTAAENQLCPTDALKRRWVEGEYFEYVVDVDRCVGCARCVEGCTLFGNGSLFLQIDRKLCVDCNECSIARVCPSEAISRIPISKAYLLKDKFREG